MKGRCLRIHYWKRPFGPPLSAVTAPKVGGGNDGVVLRQSEQIAVACDEIFGLGCEEGSEHGDVARIARASFVLGLWLDQLCLQGQDVNKICKVAGLPLQPVIEAR